MPEVTVRSLTAYLRSLQWPRRSSRTATRKLYAFRAFYSWLVKKKVIRHNPTAFVRLKKNWLTKSRSCSEKVVHEILDRARRCARGPHRSERERLLAIRDWAIMEFLYGSGVRREECCNLDVWDVIPETRTVIPHGKGNKDRVVSITESALEALQIYTRDARPGLLRRSQTHTEDRALFLTWQGNRIAPKTLNHVTKGMTPHQYRHSYAQHSADHGASLTHIQQQLGHVSRRSTAIYAGELSFDQFKEAHKLFHPRARKRGAEESQDKESRQ